VVPLSFLTVTMLPIKYVYLMDFKDHKVWLILGIVVLAIGVLFLVPWVGSM